MEETKYYREDWLTRGRGKEKGRGLDDLLLRLPNCAYLLWAVCSCAPLCRANEERLPDSQAGDFSARWRYTTKRFVKRQSMQWTKRGAHLRLQTRVKVLNNELVSTFRRWYPDFQVGEIALAA